MIVRTSLLVLLCFLHGVCLATVTPLTTVEGMTEYRLDNGMRVILAPDASKQTASVNITYRVGSRMEGSGETGMAHLLEHLMFKGTPDHPEINRGLTEHGMKSNASTWVDRTNYFEVFAASPENLEWALRMEADRMVNSFIARRDLDSEMTVVRNEMERGENNPYNVLFQIAENAAYRWHPYGKPTIGARSDVENVPIENLQRFYRRYYQPDNAVLVISGAFDTARTLTWVVNYFGVIPRPSRVLTPTYTIEPPQEGPRTVTLERVGENRMVLALYHVPPALHPDHVALAVLRTLLSMPGGRLAEALVSPHKAIHVDSWLPDTYDPGVIEFEATARRDDDPAEVRRLLLKTLEDLATNPPTEEEVARARQRLHNTMDRQLDDPASFGIALSESIAVGDWRYFFWQRGQIGKVTPADVLRVAQAYLKPANRTVGEFIPVSAPVTVSIPGRANLNAAFDALPPQPTIAQGEDFDPTPANLDARTRHFTLANGMQLAMLPKRTRGEKVRLSIELRMGDADTLAGKGTLISLAGSLLQSGTRLHSRTQIARQFEELESRLTVSSAGTLIRLDLDSRRSHLPQAIALLREILREPTFPKDELRRVVRQRVGDAHTAALDPATQAARKLTRHLNPLPPEDPRYINDDKEFEAAATNVTHEALMEFWQHFPGGEHARIGAVGDFDADTLHHLLQDALGDWHSERPYHDLPEQFQNIPALTRIIEMPGKQNAELDGGLRLPLGETDTDYPAMRVATELLGGGFLSSRLATRLRQKEGLSYHVSASLKASSTTSNATLTLNATYAPQNRARVEQAVREEIQRAYADGFTSQELEDCRKALLQSLRQARTNDAAIASQLIRNMRLKRSFAYSAQFEERIAHLTLTELNTATGRYLDPAKLSLIFAGSFAEAAE